MTMAVGVSPAPFRLHIGPAALADFVRWVRTHRSAVVVAYLLGFAYPVTSLASAFGIATGLSTTLVASGIFRTAVQGLLNGSMFLLAGYFLQRLALTGWR